jgi:hypothetical protein
VLDLAAATAATRDFFAREERASSPSTATPSALSRRCGHCAIETRVLDLESGPWPLSDERFDAIVVTNYLHRPRCLRFCALVGRRRAHLRDVRARQRSVWPSFQSRFPAAKGRAPAAGERRLTVVAFEQGVVAAPPSVPWFSGSRGRPGRPWPPPLPSGCQVELVTEQSRAARFEWGKILCFRVFFHADRKSRRHRDAHGQGRVARLSRAGQLIDFHVANGTSGIVVVGTTGESPTVDVEEHCR